MAQRDLKRVRQVVERKRRLRKELAGAILAAHESGESIRDIAEFAGLSSSRVFELLNEARCAAERQRNGVVNPF